MAVVSSAEALASARTVQWIDRVLANPAVQAQIEAQVVAADTSATGMQLAKQLSVLRGQLKETAYQKIFEARAKVGEDLLALNQSLSALIHYSSVAGEDASSFISLQRSVSQVTQKLSLFGEDDANGDGVKDAQGNPQAGPGALNNQAAGQGAPQGNGQDGAPTLSPEDAEIQKKLKDVPTLDLESSDNLADDSQEPSGKIVDPSQALQEEGEADENADPEDPSQGANSEMGQAVQKMKPKAAPAPAEKAAPAPEADAEEPAETEEPAAPAEEEQAPEAAPDAPAEEGADEKDPFAGEPGGEEKADEEAPAEDAGEGEGEAPAEDGAEAPKEGEEKAPAGKKAPAKKKGFLDSLDEDEEKPEAEEEAPAEDAEASDDEALAHTVTASSDETRFLYEGIYKDSLKFIFGNTVNLYKPTKDYFDGDINKVDAALRASLAQDKGMRTTIKKVRTAIGQGKLTRVKRVELSAPQIGTLLKSPVDKAQLGSITLPEDTPWTYRGIGVRKDSNQKTCMWFEIGSKEFGVAPNPKALEAKKETEDEFSARLVKHLKALSNVDGLKFVVGLIKKKILLPLYAGPIGGEAAE